MPLTAYWPPLSPDGFGDVRQITSEDLSWPSSSIALHQKWTVVNAFRQNLAAARSTSSDGTSIGGMSPDFRIALSETFVASRSRAPEMIPKKKRERRAPELTILAASAICLGLVAVSDARAADGAGNGGSGFISKAALKGLQRQQRDEGGALLVLLSSAQDKCDKRLALRYARELATTFPKDPQLHGLMIDLERGQAC